MSASAPPFDKDDFLLVLQQFGNNKNTLIPLIGQHIDMTNRFNDEISGIVSTILDNIKLIKNIIVELTKNKEALQERIAELEDALIRERRVPRADPRMIEELQRQIDAMKTENEELVSLLGNVKQQIKEFNDLMETPPYNMTADTIAQLAAKTEQIKKQLLESDSIIKELLSSGPGGPPPGFGGPGAPPPLGPGGASSGFGGPGAPPPLGPGGASSGFGGPGGLPLSGSSYASSPSFDFRSKPGSVVLRSPPTLGGRKRKNKTKKHTYKRKINRKKYKSSKMKKMKGGYVYSKSSSSSKNKKKKSNKSNKSNKSKSFNSSFYINRSNNS